MCPKGVNGPIVGAQMSDLELLSHPAGMGILADENNILKIEGSEELRSEFSPNLRLDSSTPIMLQDDDLQVWDLGGRAVVPGLVDAHTHLIWSGDRSSEIALRQQGCLLYTSPSPRDS